MNELLVLEQIHLFVEALDGYFNSSKFLYSYRTFAVVFMCHTKFKVCILYDFVCCLYGGETFE